jgi:signal transduction histidine kinase
MVLGRYSEQAPLTDHSISRNHAQLRRVNGSWSIEDCHSSNGTYVNGMRIHSATRVRHGDQIRLGGTLLVFTGDDSIPDFAHAKRSLDVVDLNGIQPEVDSSILASAPANDDSVILASPETSEAVHSWNVVYQIAETIGTFVSVDDFLNRMTDIIFRHLHVDRIFVLMREEQSGKLEPRIVRCRSKKDNEKVRIATSRSVINHILETKEGVLCANAQNDARFGAGAKDSSLHRMGLRSVICVPILAHEEVVGIIHFDCNMAHHTYSQSHLLLATTIGRMAGMAVENARLMESRMRHERLAAVGETVAHLSHTIRNILQGMGSGADVIEMGLRRESLENVGAGWQIVQRNVDRIYRLASNMLTFSKERQPQVELAQLNAVVEEVIVLCRRQAHDKGVTLAFEPEEMPAIPLDVDGIHQVASNVIINAIDAAPKDTGRVVVKTHYDADGGSAVLSIADNGPGIPKDDLGLIFNAFHSTKGQRGTGLGLPAAKKIVEELSGRIVVSSSSEGTTFDIHLRTVFKELQDSEKTHGPPQSK